MGSRLVGGVRIVNLVIDAEPLCGGPSGDVVSAEVVVGSTHGHVLIVTEYPHSDVVVLGVPYVVFLLLSFDSILVCMIVISAWASSYFDVECEIWSEAPFLGTLRFDVASTSSVVVRACVDHSSEFLSGLEIERAHVTLICCRHADGMVLTLLPIDVPGLDGCVREMAVFWPPL